MKVLFFHVFIVALCALSACGGINRYFDGSTSDRYTPTVRLIKESPESVIELSPDDPQYNDRLSRLNDYFFYRLRWNEPLKDTRTIRLTEKRFSALEGVKSSEKDSLRTVVFERSTLESPLFRIKREGKSSLGEPEMLFVEILPPTNDPSHHTVGGLHYVASPSSYDIGMPAKLSFGEAPPVFKMLWKDAE